MDYLFLLWDEKIKGDYIRGFQSLFYWITYSYDQNGILAFYDESGFNPYFIGLPILIFSQVEAKLKKYTDVSILILLDYLFL